MKLLIESDVLNNKVSSRYGLISIIWYKDTQIIDIDILDGQIDNTIIRQNKKGIPNRKNISGLLLI